MDGMVELMVLSLVYTVSSGKSNRYVLLACVTALIVTFGSLPSGECITCLQNESGSSCKTDCTCLSNNVCYVRKRYVAQADVFYTNRGCYSNEVGKETFCSRNRSDDVVVCCGTENCTADESLVPVLEVELARLALQHNSTSTPEVVYGGDGDLVLLLYVLPLAAVLWCCILNAMLVGYHILSKKRRHRKSRICSKEFKDSDSKKSPACAYLNVDEPSSMNSGHGTRILAHRTIAFNVKIIKLIGSGRFGQVFVGVYQGEKIAIKKFASRDEKSWFRETEIYNTVLLRHDNILGFFASDVFSSSGMTELWLITQYHPHGSLYDYLNLYTVPPKIAMRMAVTMCRGLTHLHTEFLGTISKPAIAHRDIKSKNVLIKNNLECCIADFGLSVMKGSGGPLSCKQGTKRYMAPEILGGTINMDEFESFVQADLYALGLVLWEICSRCKMKEAPMEDYVPPFHGMVPPDPTLEDMKSVVWNKKLHPCIPSSWKETEGMQRLSYAIKECWYFNHSARPSALCIKQRLSPYNETTEDDHVSDWNEPKAKGIITITELEDDCIGLV